MRSNRGSGAGPFFWGAIAGGLVGATVALLLAPAEGSETRESLGEKFDDLSGSLAGILHRAKLSAEKALNDGRDESERIIEEAKSRAEDLIENADKTISAARKAATRRTNAGTASTGDSAETADASMNGVGHKSKADSAE
jgi:gas vesicle protein